MTVSPAVIPTNAAKDLSAEPGQPTEQHEIIINYCFKQPNLGVVCHIEIDNWNIRRCVNLDELNACCSITLLMKWRKSAAWGRGMIPRFPIREKKTALLLHAVRNTLVNSRGFCIHGWITTVSRDAVPIISTVFEGTGGEAAPYKMGFNLKKGKEQELMRQNIQVHCTMQ